jgi:hypothetical protein
MTQLTQPVQTSEAWPAQGRAKASTTLNERHSLCKSRPSCKAKQGERDQGIRVQWKSDEARPLSVKPPRSNTGTNRWISSFGASDKHVPSNSRGGS